MPQYSSRTATHLSLATFRWSDEVSADSIQHRIVLGVFSRASHDIFEVRPS